MLDKRAKQRMAMFLLASQATFAAAALLALFRWMAT